MRSRVFASVFALLGLSIGSTSALGQQLIRELQITAKSANTWTQGPVQVMQLEGPLTITTQDAKMSARQAVIWVSMPANRLIDERRVQIALIGEADLVQPNHVEQSGDRLMIDTLVAGAIRLTADARDTNDLHESELYKAATAIRPADLQTQKERDETSTWLLQPGFLPTTLPTTQAATRPTPRMRVNYGADHAKTVNSREGTVAVVLQGHVSLTEQRPDGSLIELRADNVVLFTSLKSLRDTQTQGAQLEDAIVGAYLDGDVRVERTPGNGSRKSKAEQRILADRVYYDFVHDRAVLTQVVLHTIDEKTQTPVVIRAQLARQLSAGEFTMEGARITSSQFATPSIALGASEIYVRQTQNDDELNSQKIEFSAKSATLRLEGLPIFWFPYAGGVYNDRGPLRDFQVGSSSRRGIGLQTEWGVYETLGKVPPDDFDFSYRADYFTKRGPGFGLDGKYIGDATTELAKDPWTFSGDFTLYTLFSDHGDDRLGESRQTVKSPTDWRGRFYLEHQLFIPDDYQIQLTLSYISDPTFLEHWFPDDFNTQTSRDISLYIKRQHDSEAVSILFAIQPNNFPTNSDQAQEQADIERYPEITYERIGEPVLGGAATLYSADTVSAMRFQSSRASLVEQGYALTANTGLPESPGIPSYGYTGTPADTTLRADFRQELDLPLTLGQVKATPFVMARYTAYSQAPADNGGRDRTYAGAGLRMSTVYWKVDNSFISDTLDIHRIRHVVEPELNLFYGGQSASRDSLLVYDEDVDALNAIGVMQLALHQRWQTKRGGPGRWRNVDLLSLNVEMNWYFRKPKDDDIAPSDFRGLFFPSAPEASVPRSGINAEAALLISDNATLLADAFYNTDDNKLATGAIGLQVTHSPRLTWYAGFRYIGQHFDRVLGNGTEFNFNDQKLLVFTMNYQLTSKYILSIDERYDFADPDNVRSSVSLIRHFDRFYLGITARVDKVGQDSFIGFNFYPEGLGARKGSSALTSALSANR